MRLEPGRGGERIGYDQAGFLETTQTQFATALNSLRRPFQSLIPPKYAATGGWGFGHFNDGKPADEAVLNTCFACHAKIESRDLVFTRYAQ